jgi:glutaredoxin
MTTSALTRFSRLATLATAVLIAPNLAARTVVECIDESGQKSFREFCPPGSLKKGEKKLQGKLAPGVDVGAIAAKSPVTIYTIPKCDACDLMRLQLQQRGVPFTEKDASTDPVVQDELKALTGTKENLVKVPVLTVGKEVVGEYKPAEVNAKLDEAGYPAAAGTAGAAQTAKAGTAPTNPPTEAAPPATAEGSAAASGGTDNKPVAQTIVAQ